MRKTMIAALVIVSLVTSGCLIWETANARGQPGGASKKGVGPAGRDSSAMVMNQDPGTVFDMLAKGREFFLISETRSLRDPLTFYAQEKGIAKDQISRAQFMDFHAQYKAKLEASGGQPGGGGKKGPMGGGVFGQAGPGSPKPTPWEYRVLTRESLAELGKANFEAGLNHLGSECWELIGIETNKANVHTYIFRRPNTKGTIVIREEQLNGPVIVLRAGKLPGPQKPGADAKPAAEPAPKLKAEERFEFRVYRLKHAKATVVASLIDELMRAGKQDPLRVVPDPNTNQLLLKGSTQVLLDIEAILQRLDVPGDAEASAPPGPGKKGLPGFKK